MAEFTQHYESLGSVVAQALGGEQAESKPKAKPTQSWEEAQLMAASLFS